MLKPNVKLVLMLLVTACGTPENILDAAPFDAAVRDVRPTTDNALPNDAGTEQDVAMRADAAVDALIVDSRIDTGDTTLRADGGDAGRPLAPLVCTNLPVLNCGDNPLSSDNVGAVNAIGGYCSTSTAYTGGERLYRISVIGTQEVSVQFMAATGTTANFDVFAYPSDGTTCAPPTSGSTCARDVTTSSSGTVNFAANATDHNFVVAYDSFNSANTTSYMVRVTCTPTICGDGNRRANEACDDANTVAGDGCSSTCTIEPNATCSGLVAARSRCTLCGDGNRAASEVCDDGNTSAGDGCSATCAVESMFACFGAAGTRSSCAMIACGNAIRTSNEGCDDGNTSAGDGCSAACQIEAHSECAGAAGARSVCVVQICGDAARGSTEDCDDGNTTAGDGCSATCTVESMFACFGALDSLSTCSRIACGNGIRTTAEACDDGNTTAGDGCTASCMIEADFACFGATGVVSACARFVCGNGVRTAAEVCDDGNTTANDGCSSTCTVESSALACTNVLGERSVCGPATHTVMPLTGLTCTPDSVNWTVVTLSSRDDGASTIIALPPGFTFMSEAIGGFSITTNGFVQLWTSTTGIPSTSYFNTHIPTADVPNAFIAPLWDDLYAGTGADEGAARYALINGNLVVQWKGWTVGSSGAATTFQLALTPSGVIEFAYCAGFAATGRLSGSEATIGVENATGTNGTRISVNTVGAVSNGAGYRLTPR